MKAIIKWFIDLDENEKYFALLALAFLLVALFLVITNSSSTYIEDENAPKVYIGYTEIDVEEIELTELQMAVCNYADKYETCGKINETYITATLVCCKKLGKCCVNEE